MRVNPVGASTSGYASGRPRIVDVTSIFAMPRSTRGRNVDVGEGALVRGERALVFGAAVDVVEHAAGQTPLGDTPQVGDRRRPLEPPFHRVGLDAVEADDRPQRPVDAHDQILACDPRMDFGRGGRAPASIAFSILNN